MDEIGDPLPFVSIAFRQIKFRAAYPALLVDFRQFKLTKTHGGESRKKQMDAVQVYRQGDVSITAFPAYR